jgi:hypothetical protein
MKKSNRSVRSKSRQKQYERNKSKSKKTGKKNWKGFPKMFLMINSSQCTYHDLSSSYCQKQPPFKRANSKVRSSVKKNYGSYFDPKGSKNRHFCRQNIKLRDDKVGNASKFL